MLEERFIACSRSAPLPPAANTAQLKDAGIFLHKFQPQPTLESTFKKSQAQQNCIAWNDSHMFAAQSQKAVVHVYNRDKGNHEATVPYPERMRSVTMTADGSVLALGTESGQLVLWEVYTGRQITTPALHLQAVTFLVADPSNSFLLSGSPDALVLVWSLVDLLSFAAPSLSMHENIKFRHNLTGHSAAITALAVGHNSTSTNLALSASEDKTLVAWNYHEGVQLRTILLNDVPRCLTLDPADRAAFTGFDDGSVQRIDFYSTSSTRSTIHDQTLSATPLQPPASSRWHAASSDPGQEGSKAALSLTLSYDGTTLLSGHGTGAINKWDVAAGRFAGTLAHHSGAPITHVAFETPDGLKTAPTRRGTAIVKPRPHEAFSRFRSTDLGAGYCASLAFSRHQRHEEQPNILNTVGVNHEMLEAGAEDLAEWASGSASKSRPMTNGGNAKDLDDDMIMLNGDTADDEEVQRLQQRLAVMEEAQKKLGTEMAGLRKESKTLKMREREQLAKRAKKERLKKTKVDKEWNAIARGQQAAVGMVPQIVDDEMANGEPSLAQEADDSASGTSNSEISDS